MNFCIVQEINIFKLAKRVLSFDLTVSDLSVYIAYLYGVYLMITFERINQFSWNLACASILLLYRNILFLRLIPPKMGEVEEKMWGDCEKIAKPHVRYQIKLNLTFFLFFFFFVTAYTV